MKWLWFVGAGITWIASAGCIFGTLYELGKGKAKARKPVEFWGAVVFHGATAILALWLLIKGLSVS